MAPSPTALDICRARVKELEAQVAELQSVLNTIVDGPPPGRGSAYVRKGSEMAAAHSKGRELLNLPSRTPREPPARLTADERRTLLRAEREARHEARKADRIARK